MTLRRRLRSNVSSPTKIQEEDERIKYASEALLSFKNGIPSPPNNNMKTKIKEEEETTDDDFAGSNNCVDDKPARDRTLASPPRDSKGSPQPALNRRGMPARIRKKNRLFYDDDVITSENNVVPKSLLKSPRGRPALKKQKKPREPPDSAVTKTETNGDRKLNQKIGMKLRNLLRLPKAHKWVCYEWFYSNIDNALFGGENDFRICLRESFPQLKTNTLTRVEWCKLRRIMGKPRRCSQAFFEEERRELERKRGKIRQLQQRKPTDINSCKDLPNEIPLQIVIGTKVTARLRASKSQTQDGLFTGTVEAFDTSNNTYRITFERPGLGTHSIPDIEVLSNEPVETISVLSMIHALRPPKRDYDHISDAHQDGLDTSSQNGFPLSDLENFVRLNKLLDMKRVKVASIRDMNIEVERKRSYSISLNDDFVRKYASAVIELENINAALRELLATIQTTCEEVLPDLNMSAILTPSALRNQTIEETKKFVEELKTTVRHPSVLNLVIELTSLLSQIKGLCQNERSSYEMEVISSSIEAIKKLLSPSNKAVFESCVEIHARHVQAGLAGEVGTFSMFMGGRH